MAENTVVLCGANSYNEKFYLNPEFESLPASVKDELKILCVSITEEAGGILTLEFDPDGNLNFVSRAEDGDYLFDDITSTGGIRRIDHLLSEVCLVVLRRHRTIAGHEDEGRRAKTQPHQSLRGDPSYDLVQFLFHIG